MVFAELLMDSRYGIERDAIQQESLELLPVVPFESLSAPHRRKVVELSKRLDRGLTEALADEIDDLIFDTFALSSVERESIQDTLETMLPTTKAKRRAVEVPGKVDRERFIETLCSSLNNVLSVSNQRAVVREHLNASLAPWRILEVCIARDTVPVEKSLPLQAFLEEADRHGASLVVVRADKATWFVGLLERYVQWTPTRARLLASDLIAERSAQ
jgi:hypothetical protein